MTEDPPTKGQLQNILDYLGPPGVQNKGPGAVVQGATSVQDAVKKFAADSGAFVRPVVRLLTSPSLHFSDELLIVRLSIGYRARSSLETVNRRFSRWFDHCLPMMETKERLWIRQLNR